MKTTLTKAEMIAELTRVRDLVETLVETNAEQIEMKAAILRNIDYFTSPKRPANEIRSYFAFFKRDNEQFKAWTR